MSHIDQAEMRSGLLGYFAGNCAHSCVPPKLVALPLDWGTGRICRHVPCGECSKVVPPKPLVSSAAFQRVLLCQILPARPLGLADKCD